MADDAVSLDSNIDFDISLAVPDEPGRLVLDDAVTGRDADLFCKLICPNASSKADIVPLKSLDMFKTGFEIFISLFTGDLVTNYLRFSGRWIC